MSQWMVACRMGKKMGGNRWDEHGQRTKKNIIYVIITLYVLLEQLGPMHTTLLHAHSFEPTLKPKVTINPHLHATMVLDGSL
jgi:hypothetical protein